MQLENANYMKYIAGDAYFCKAEDRIKQYPYLNQNIKSDILIIGGGIDGAILNFICLRNIMFGNMITCKNLILSTGFDFSLMKEKNLIDRVVSYSIVTKPIENLSWKENALVQDDKEPYHYLRILPDNRLIFGGEDTTFKEKEIDLKLAKKKYDKLLKDLKKMLPKYEDLIETEYEFCGVFGSTPNNLGLIGRSENPNILYFLSAGANGIINAMSGAKLIEDLLKNRENPLKNLFSPMRQ
jgi:glycine/D-amino acid oxidase-like deaminating enzyme